MSISQKPAAYRYANVKHVTGIMIFSIPLLLQWKLPGFQKEELTRLPDPDPDSFLLYLALLIITCQLALRAARKTTSLIQLPAFPAPGALHLFLAYAFIRTAFLICYELFFRGVLLCSCNFFLPLPASILINLTLYAAAHARSSRSEIAGCIPFGLITCLLTLQSHSIWPAVGLHLALSHVYDVHVLYFSTKPYSIQPL